MKKSILFLAGAVLLFAGCAKVEDEAPIPETGKRVVTLKATIDEADTRVSVETDGTYHWQAGDEIGVWVVDSDGGVPYKYTTEDSGTTANFAVTLDDGEAIGEYAFYPYSEDSFVDGEGPRVALDANLDYVEGTTYMPMLGTISSDGTISFKSVGGVIKLTVNNIPSNAARLLFSAKDTDNENLVISGVFPVSGDQITAGGIMGLNSVNIDFTDKWKSSMEFYVPLPTGTYGGFELEFVNANSSETLVSKKVNFGQTGLTVSRNQIIVAPALDAAPPVVEKYYTKVNSNADLVSGQYLIVYEEGSVAFNGALGTLDAVNNGISVVMNNGKILSTPETDAASFTINIGSTNSTIKSASGYYIGQTSDANGLKSSTTEAYTNTITYDSDGNAVNISSGGAYLRYNKNSDQKRFRFFKSSTYTSQQAIALFKLDTSAPRVLDYITLGGNYPTEFYVNDTFSYEGLTITAYFTDGSTNEVAPTSISTPDLSQVADNISVTVSFTYNGVTKNASYNISVIERPVYIVTLADDNSTLTATAGESVNLPTRNIEGYTFEGWSETNITEAVTTAPSTIPAGSYTPTNSLTLYPVFSSGEEVTGWVRTALSDVTAGNYILLTEDDYAFDGVINSSGHGEIATPVVSFDDSGLATSIPNKACVITFIATSEGFKMYSEGKGYLYAKKAASGNLAWNENEETSYWLYKNDNWTYESNDAFLRSYNNLSFRTYATNNGKLLKLAKLTTITSKSYISNPQ